MKIKCDFCKTEYSLSCSPSGAVKCAVCGNVWRAPVKSRRGSFTMFIAALTALMAALVFAVAVVAHDRANSRPSRPLVARVSDIRTVTDAAGTAHFVVSGDVINQSDEIYGVPDLIITSRDASGAPIARQKFMPSATLLDAGGRVSFSHTLSAPAAGVKKITVELLDMEGDNK